MLHQHPLVALLAFPLGASTPLLAVLSARARRSTKLSDQLPDALEMIVRSLRAGHGVANGFKLVAGEMRPPVAVEFGRCFEEQQFGVTLKAALENMTRRVPDNLDLRIFAVSVAIQRDTGGNLVENLEQIAGTIRERYKFFGKLCALTAEGRWSGYMLGVLPFASLLFVMMYRAKYLRPLVDDPLGRTIAMGGAALWLVGVVWMNRMTKVDY